MPSGAPIWSSGFRPFYLLGALYAPLLVVGAGGALEGLVDLTRAGSAAYLWHGHEMLFGFAGAIIVGTLLTALPSWAGTPEVRGKRLALLVGLWLLGRFAFSASPWLAPPITALADGLLLPVLCAVLSPALWRVPDRRYRLLPPILLALALANAVHLAGMLGRNPALAGLGLHAGVYTVMLLYVLVGGLLTPVFTGNALRQRGLGDQARFIPALEWLAAGAVVLLAVLDLMGAARPWVAATALACACIQVVRTARWRGWLVASDWLVWAMHLGFAWLMLSLVLKALAGPDGMAPTAWLHAFTMGGLGLMMLALMTRVALRHTGRPLVAPSWLRWACATLFAAALLRVSATVGGLGIWAIALAATMWAAPFMIYATVFASALVGPSLPRSGAPPQA